MWPEGFQAAEEGERREAEARLGEEEVQEEQMHEEEGQEEDHGRAEGARLQATKTLTTANSTSEVSGHKEADYEISRQIFGMRYNILHKCALLARIVPGGADMVERVCCPLKGWTSFRRRMSALRLFPRLKMMLLVILSRLSSESCFG